MARSVAIKAANELRKLVRSPGHSIEGIASPPRPSATGNVNPYLPSVQEDSMPSLQPVTPNPSGLPQSRPTSTPRAAHANELDYLGRSPSLSHVSHRNRSIFESFHGGIVGMTEDSKSATVYFVGIIDILQQYTFKKKLAHFIKKRTIGCCHEIDTEPPAYYRSRFVKFFIDKVRPIEPENARLYQREVAAMIIQRSWRAGLQRQTSKQKSSSSAMRI